MERTGWTIYCHTHVDSGRRYVGLTKLTMMKRWNQHVQNAKAKRGKGCAHFWAAIRLYGKDAFSHEVLEVCHDLEVANLAEERWIELYDTRNPERGFNLAKGGLHVPHPKKNPWDRPEYREKAERLILPKLVAAGQTPEARAKSRATNRTAESREKASERTGKQFSDPSAREAMSAKLKELHQNPELHARFQKGLLAANARRSSKTHCKNGHEFIPKNTKVDERGWRSCKRCASDRVCKRDHEARTRCPKGHEYSPDNVALSASGERMCLRCKASAVCKRGHDLSLPGARYAGQRGCRLCTLARGRILDAKRRAVRRDAVSLPL